MKHTKKNLSIVVLSYNVRELLDACLKSLYKDPQSSSWHIIVVDNASKDDSVKYIKKHYPQVEMIASQTNLGFSAGNNKAIPKLKGEYVLFLNPDTIVPEGTIPQIMEYLQKHSHVGAATCKVLLPSGQLDEGCHRGFPTPWNSFCHFTNLSKIFPQIPLFNGYTQSYKDLNTIHGIDALTGAFMMLPRKVGDQVKWWDEDYFWNGEDIDFCYRIKHEGYEIMYIPTVSITHFKGSSAGYKTTSHGKQSVSTETKRMAAKSSTQAMRIFYRKHYQPRTPQIINQLVFYGIQLLENKRLKQIEDNH